MPATPSLCVFLLQVGCQGCYVPSLREVYGDWVHANPGTHLDGGIRDDLALQAWWRDLAVMPSMRYDAPSGRVGRRFVGTLGADLKGVRDRLWNSERFIVFRWLSCNDPDMSPHPRPSFGALKID